MVAVVGIAVAAAAAVEVKFVVVVGDQLALAELANAFVIVMENVVVVVKEGIVESENAKADQEVSVVAVVVAGLGDIVVVFGAVVVDKLGDAIDGLGPAVAGN